MRRGPRRKGAIWDKSSDKVWNQGFNHARHDVAGLAKSYIRVSKLCFLGLKKRPYLWLPGTPPRTGQLVWVQRSLLCLSFQIPKHTEGEALKYILEVPPKRTVNLAQFTAVSSAKTEVPIEASSPAQALRPQYQSNVLWHGMCGLSRWGLLQFRTGPCGKLQRDRSRTPKGRVSASPLTTCSPHTSFRRGP